MSSVFGKHGEHINVANRFAMKGFLPRTRRADRNIFVNDETEAVWIEIGLANNVSVGILSGSFLVYEGAVHYSCPMYLISLLIGTDMIPIRTLEYR